MYVSYVKYVIKNKSDEWRTKSEFRHLLSLKKCDLFQKLIVAFQSALVFPERERECVREVRVRFGLGWVGLGKQI
jgi:hypothetical protein